MAEALTVLAKGTLVQVRGDHHLSGGDKGIVEDHGWLWIAEGNGNSLTLPDLHHYRSLATGYPHVWFLSEVRIAGEEQANG